MTDTLSPNILEAIEASIEKIVTQQLSSFAHTLQRRFDKIDQRFDDIDRRFDDIDRRFDEVDQRFNKIDQQFDENEMKQNEILDAIGEQFDNHEMRLVTLEK